MDPGRAEEAAVERELSGILERFRAEPKVALGLPADADAAAARAAFMALCKRYHPAKFARRGPAVARLANEAFLSIRRAYDEVLRSFARPIATPKAASAPTTSAGSAAAAGDARKPRRPDPSPPPPTRPAFDRALDLARERRWAEARPLLVELAAQAPTDARYRAYLHYVRGWEAYELGKPGEARAEWQRALACDPALGIAQWALGKTGLG